MGISFLNWHIFKVKAFYLVKDVVHDIGWDRVQIKENLADL